MRRARRKRGNEDRRSRYSVRRNAIEFSGIEWTRAATKHRISRARSGYVVEQAGWCLVEPRPPRLLERDVRFVFVGGDADGVPLEVMCVKSEGRLLVIHAMLLRDRYRTDYEEQVGWQRKSDIR